MITLYFAPPSVLNRLITITNERELIRVVYQDLAHYQIATQINSDELDLAYAAAGGPSPWALADQLPILSTPDLERSAKFGDILLENASGYANLATPAGFIPLVDVECYVGLLRLKQYN